MPVLSAASAALLIPALHCVLTSSTLANLLTCSLPASLALRARLTIATRGRPGNTLTTLAAATCGMATLTLSTTRGLRLSRCLRFTLTTAPALAANAVTNIVCIHIRTTTFAATR